MRKKVVLFALVLVSILLVGGCKSPAEKKIDAWSKQPAPTSMAEAIEQYKEVDNLLRWHAKNQPLPPDEKKKAEALRDRKAEQAKALGWDGLKGGVGKAADAIDKTAKATVDALKKVDWKGKAKWVAGVDDPRYKQFACDSEVSDCSDIKNWP